MKKEFTFLLFISLIYVSSYSQSFFSKIIDFGGDEMEGRAYNVIPLQDEIKIIGLMHDSMVAGFDGGTWPVLGSMAYSSEYLNSTILIDSIYSDGFYYFTRRVAFKNDAICYLSVRRHIGSPLLDAYLIEMNFRTGRILNSKIIYDEISNNAGFLATDMALGKNGNIYLINITDASGTHPQILTVLDSNLVIETQTFIPNFGRNNFTKYTEEDSEGNLILIGVSLGESNGIWFESKLFRQVLDKSFKSIDFNLAPTLYDQTIIGVDYYPVIKAKN